MRFFDSHAHLDDARFEEDREELLRALPQTGLVGCVNAAGSLADSRAAMALAERIPWIWAGVGIHPHAAEEATEDAMRFLRESLRAPKVMALGEIGLDYYYKPFDRELQLRALDMQFPLAQGMPIIYHVRDAWGDFMPWLREHPNPGVMHCWSGSLESAKICLDAGLYLAFGGSSTFKSAAKLREVAAYVPKDRLLVETDCPYLTPEPLRGQRNDPGKVSLVLQCLAAVRGTSPEELGEVTCLNACRLFRIDPGALLPSP